MNFDKYSRSSFEKLNPKEARALADEVQELVQLELDKSIKDAFTKIIEKFNSVGHNLTIYDESPGDFAYRDSDGFRLAVDTVISSGFRDAVDDVT